VGNCKTVVSEIDRRELPARDIAPEKVRPLDAIWKRRSRDVAAFNASIRTTTFLFARVEGRSEQDRHAEGQQLFHTSNRNREFADIIQPARGFFEARTRTPAQRDQLGSVTFPSPVTIGTERPVGTSNKTKLDPELKIMCRESAPQAGSSPLATRLVAPLCRSFTAMENPPVRAVNATLLPSGDQLGSVQ